MALRRPPSSSSTRSPQVRQGSGGHQHGPDGVRGGVGERILLRRPPHAADLHGYGGGGGRRREHQQAGAQYAYQLASTPLSVPTGSTTSRTSKRQTSSYPRPQWGAPTPPSSADAGPSTLHVRIMSCSPHNRCRGIACHVREERKKENRPPKRGGGGQGPVRECVVWGALLSLFHGWCTCVTVPDGH